MTAICARIAGVILTDPHGRLLLQLRDGNTRVDPHRWCLPGGDIEAGEEPDQAALRELYEETGLKPDGPLTLFYQGVLPSARFPGAQGEYHVYWGTTTAGQDQVQCNEGAAMTFIPGHEVADLEFGAAYSIIVPAFLTSTEYRTHTAHRIDARP